MGEMLIMLRPATDDDYEAMFGMPAPVDWWGYVEAGPWLIEGIGLIYRAIEGRYWLSLQRIPGVRKTKLAHAQAKRLLAEADAKGLTVHALADPAFDKSAIWIERLGFARTDETLGEHTVWARRQ